MNIREKFNYTQHPESECKFLASEMATALGITIPSFYELAKKLDLDRTMENDYRGRKAAFFDHAALARCREELERRERKESPRPEVQAALEAAKEEHPLVTDERFLKLSYFPDIVPACFAEVDE